MTPLNSVQSHYLVGTLTQDAEIDVCQVLEVAEARLYTSCL